MKKSFQKAWLFIFIIASIGILSFHSSPSYADDFKVVADKDGLKVTPQASSIFDLNNLNPGDKEEREITLENKYADCYIDIFVRTERASKAPEEGEADLLEQLKVKVYLEEALIYDGEMKAFASANTSLGTLEFNKDKKIRIVVYLPGYETGNEFQGKEIKVNWIFTAESNCSSSDLPTDPNLPYIPIDPSLPDLPTETDDPDLPMKPNIPNAPTDPSLPNMATQAKDPNIPREATKTEMAVLKEKSRLLEETIGRLVQTGATPDIFYYVIGSLMFFLGYFICKKK